MRKKLCFGIAAAAVVLTAVLVMPKNFDSLFEAEGCRLRVMRMSLDLSQPSDDTLYEQSPETTEKVIQLLRSYRYSKLWTANQLPYNQGALIFMIFQADGEQAGFQMIFDGKLIFCRSSRNEQYYRVLGGSELFAALDGIIELGTPPPGGSMRQGENVTG